MINEAVFWSKQIETILIITSRDASMRYGSNRNWLPTIQNHMKIFNLRRYFKKIKKDIHASMEQKAKQTARKATLHTWNVACLQNRTDGSCLPHEPGRTSQSNSRNTIIPLTCEAFRSCFKLIRMHICRYIYIIYMQYAAIWCCCNVYEHSRLPTAPFDSVAVVFVTFWQLCFAAIRIGDCSVAFGRDLVGGIAGPASQRTRVFSPDGAFLELHASVFSFFSFFPRWCFATFEDDTSCKPLFFFETLGELLLDWSETWDVLFSIWVCCCSLCFWIFWFSFRFSFYTSFSSHIRLRFVAFSHIFSHFFYLFILFPSVSSPEVLGPSGLLEAWGNGYWGYKLRQTRKKSTKPMRRMMRMMRMVFFLICEICEANDPTFKPNMLKATQRFSGFVWM